MNEKPKQIRFIGDVHGKYEQYLHLANNAPDDLSIQIGDLGFNYLCLENLDPNNHKILKGNHDCYDGNDSQHFLGDYGIHKSPIGPIFYVRGGLSIDKDLRSQGQNWWPKEELTFSQLMCAISSFENEKPDIVISHECPSSIAKLLFGIGHWSGNEITPSMTSQALDVAFWIHQPKVWIFGHHHRRKDEVINGTRFVCLEELGTLDWDGTIDW